MLSQGTGYCGSRRFRDHFSLRPRNPSDAPALRSVHNVADAPRGATATGVQRPLAERVTVVERQFLTGKDLAARNDHDASSDIFGPTVRRTGMIDQPGDIFAAAPVQIITSVQLENIHAAVTTTPQPFNPLELTLSRGGFRDASAEVLHDMRSVRNHTPGINAVAVNR
jgi:hypothetical protein